MPLSVVMGSLDVDRWELVVPHLVAAEDEQHAECWDQQRLGHHTREHPPTTVPPIDPAAMSTTNRLFSRNTMKLSSRPYRANATIIVGSDTMSDKLPAIRMSTPYSSTIVGISSSPRRRPSLTRPSR